MHKFFSAKPSTNVLIPFWTRHQDKHYSNNVYIKMTTHYTLATVADSWDQHNDPWPSQTEKNHQIQPLRLSWNKMWIFEKDIIAIKLLYFDNELVPFWLVVYNLV